MFHRVLSESIGCSKLFVVLVNLCALLAVSPVMFSRVYEQVKQSVGFLVPGGTPI